MDLTTVAVCLHEVTGGLLVRVDVGTSLVMVKVDAVDVAVCVVEEALVTVVVVSGPELLVTKSFKRHPTI